MDAQKYQKSDPAILLLNEIDILLAQTRLMELYLKQAQATAANEHARIHEQYESELATLRADLADKERQLQQRPVIAVERNLSATVEQLQRELSEKQQFLASQEVTFQRSSGEIAALQNRIAQLEADNNAAVSAARESNVIRESLAADVSALNQELERNRHEFHQQQLAARELESSLREQLQLLQNQVAEKQAYAFNTNDELRKAQEEIAALHQHLGSLQALQDELQSAAARELEQARGRFESELASLRAALVESDRSVLQSQAALVEIERGLRSEIDTLRNELEQRQAALGLRDDDLRAAGSQIAALQHRVTELELAHRQATAATAEIDALRHSLAEEVANLQHEVEVKEKELTHRYEAVTAVELALHGRIQALQQELARAHEASNADEVELQNSRGENATLQGRIAELERAQADTSLIEAARQQLEGDLNRLRADLARKEYLLDGREQAISDLEARFGEEIATLQQQLEQERSAAERTRGEVHQAHSELAATRQQLEAELRHKEDELGGLRASAASQSEQLSNWINELQRQLTDRENTLADLETRFGGEVAALHQQLVEERNAAERTRGEAHQAHSELAATREQLEAQLRLKDDELGSLRNSAASQSEQLSGQITALQRELAERESTVGNLEARLGEEIATLHQQLEQERSAAERTRGEVLQAHSELAATREQLESQLRLKDDELGSLRNSAAGQSEQLSGHITALQRELAEREITVANLEARFGGEIATLQQRLEQERSATERTRGEALQAHSELAATREQLEAQLRLKDDELGHLRANAAGQAEQLAQQINDLQQQLADRENIVANLEARLGEEIATLHQQFEQERSAAERTRGEVLQAHSELAATREQLEAQLKHKDDELGHLRANAAGQAEQLAQQINDLQQQLADRENIVANLEARLGGEIATLHQQLEQERSAAERTRGEALQAHSELAATREQLEAQLRLKDDELGHLRANAAGQAEQLSNRINELQLHLAEKQLLAESRGAELDHVRTAVTQLNEQLREKDTNHAQALALWHDSQTQHSTEITQLTSARDELLRSQTALEVQLDQARSANAGLRGELQEAKSRANEFDALLKSSQSALAGVETDRIRLRSELENLDALHNKTRADGARELVQLRDALESELSALRTELQQKAWSLAQQQASVENLAQVHREQMRKLEARLSEQRPVTEQQSRELEQAVSRANALQLQVEELQTALGQIQAAGASQAEQIRQEYAARLETVNSMLAAKSTEMANSGAVRANVEESLRGELSRLRSEMQSRNAALQSREEEIERVRAEMTSVQNRIVQLESVSARTEIEAREIGQAKSSLESDLTALRGELQHRSSAVAQQQAAMDELAARHRSQVEQLAANLSEQEKASDERRREVDQAQAQIALLHSRIDELQTTLQQTEVSANSRTDKHLRQEYEARIDALNRELGEHSAQLQNRATDDSDIERALRSEIDRLIGEAQERNQILQNRNDELVRVKSDLDSLADRFSQLESNAIQTESSASGDAESMRTEFQAQLALLQAELSQKEWALEERQAIIAGLEQEHRHQLDALRQQLTEKERSAAPADGAFVLGNPSLTDEQREKLKKLDDIDNELRNGNTLGNSLLSRRRWPGGFGSKRRWRS